MKSAPLNRKAVLSASAWTFVGFGANQALRLVSSLLLTRLLAPEAFGLSALAMVILVGLNLLSDIGLTQSLIRHPRAHEPAFQDTVFSIQAYRGLAIQITTLVVAAIFHFAQNYSAFPAGSTYAHPLLPTMIALVGCVSLIDGLTPTKFALASRAMQVRAITTIEFSTQIGSLVLTALIAYVTRSPVALVLASICSSCIRLGIIHLFIQGRSNRISFDKESRREITAFGRWIAVASAVSFIAGNVDKAVLAGVANSEELGTYTLAFTLYGAGAALFTKLSNSIVFPLLSQSHQLGQDVLFAKYRKTQNHLDAILLAASALCYLIAHPVVSHLYDQRYAAAGDYLSILGLGYIASRNEAIAKLSTTLGDSFLLAKTSLFKAILYPITLLIAYPAYGMEGAALCFVLIGFSDWPIILKYRQSKGLPITRQEWMLVAISATAVFAVWQKIHH